MIVCSSSMKSRILPAARTSWSTFLMRSSNSPRYFEPATIPDISKDTTRFPATVSGTIPVVIRSAIPSTIAVFPTPGSPIRHGLFFVLLLKIWITRSISSCLPTNGSNTPSAANAVRSLEYWFNTGVSDAVFFTGLPFMKSSLYRLASSPIAIRISTYIFWILTAKVFKRRDATHSVSFIIAIRICSVPISSAWKRAASLAAPSNTCSALGEYSLASAVSTCASGAMSSSISCMTLSSSTPLSFNTCAATPVPSFKSPIRICSVPI